MAKEVEVISVGSKPDEGVNFAAILVPIFLLLAIGVAVGVVFYLRHRQRKDKYLMSTEQAELEPAKEIVAFSFQKQRE